MHLCINELYKNYAGIMHVMQKLPKNYAKITQKLRKKITQNYAYVCKLHNLHMMHPPTLLMKINAFYIPGFSTTTFPLFVPDLGY